MTPAELLAKYLTARYKDGARGEDWFFDCWGLARQARVDFYGMRLLHSRGGEFQHDPQGFTEQYRAQIAAEMHECEPEVGAVAAVLTKRGVCVHVGVLTHDVYRTGRGLHVLDINPKVAAQYRPLTSWLAAFSRFEVKYYAG